MIDKENKPNHHYRNDTPRFEGGDDSASIHDHKYRRDNGTNVVQPTIQSSTLRIFGTISEERLRSQKRVELIRKMRRLKEDSIDQWQPRPVFTPIQVRNIGIQTDAIKIMDTHSDEIQIYKNKADAFLTELAKTKAEVLKVRSQLSACEKKLQASKEEFNRLKKDERAALKSKEMSNGGSLARNFFGHFCTNHTRHSLDVNQRTAALPKSMESSRERGRGHIQRTWNQSSGRVVQVEKGTISSTSVATKNPVSSTVNTSKITRRELPKAGPPKSDLSDDALVLQLMHLVHGLSVGVDLSLHLFLKQGTHGWTLRSAKVETVPGDRSHPILASSS
jgi:hypothetical protein